MNIKEDENYDVIIVGAGISGLNCANKLISEGFNVLVIEKSDSVGGRIKTDSVNGFKLNRGFHVLLTAYPEVKYTFNAESLNFKKFFPGCSIWTGTGMEDLVNPLKHPFKGIRQLIRPIGKVKDYLLLAYLCFILKFALQTKKRISTHEYFNYLGFSDLFITRFLRPFFSGVFLEAQLETSVEKFNDVFKCFLNGDVVLPLHGINSLADQLHANISDCKIIFNSEVVAISKTEVQLTNGKKFKAKYFVLASDLKSRNRLLGMDIRPKFNRVVNLYFSYNKSSELVEYKLVLNGSDSGPVNNLVCFGDDFSDDDTGLLSVSIIKPQYFELDNLEEVVLKQLEEWYGSGLGLKFLKKYDIREAVPYQPEIGKSNLKLRENIYCCGDYCGVASLNTALKSSRMIAESITSKN